MTLTHISIILLIVAVVILTAYVNKSIAKLIYLDDLTDNILQEMSNKIGNLEYELTQAKQRIAKLEEKENEGK